MNDPRELLRRKLCELQDHIRDVVLNARAEQTGADWAAIAGITAADTIYEIDKISEAAIASWFEAHWPHSEPVELVMEGIEENETVTFPRSTPVATTKWKCILDPIDGTRGIMYDKRSAWILAALAPQRGPSTSLQDVCIAAMSELPTTKQWRADQISGIKGCGRKGLIAESVNVFDGARAPLTLRPSSATDFKHGFAAWARFFPEGKSLLAQVEEELWDELYGLGSTSSPLVFDDQYISSGGQFYEILAGHDRMQGDLRPLAHEKLGFNSSLVCHPYDVCTFFLLQEAGGVVEAPDGNPLDAPLDTVSPVSWMAYANETLATQVRPILRRLMERHFR
jgi:fructose-1,6-bisphosphatase/inositol monophosphatase family enzyme